MEVRVGVSQATPEAKAPARDARIKQASTAGVSGAHRVIEGEKGTGCYHCRGCALRVWVASSIKCVKVTEEGRRVSLVVVIKGASRGKAEGHISSAVLDT